ncbi:MAG: hypothetical protein NG747_10200 [Candidatus Brocadia sp.]|nr:hypothetical protein [Candidatus Brocadia sp.]
MGALSGVELQEGLSVGAVWSVYQMAKELGIEGALEKDFQGKLALWQVMARVIDQGSRLSAVRLAQVHAAGDVLDMRRGFDENDLYENLSWLSEHQTRIEQKLFQLRRGGKKPRLFLYDVTSSYLEGEQNHFGEYGYNRDGKKGKKQIVIGMLCDESGEPVSMEVFRGNVWRDTSISDHLFNRGKGERPKDTLSEDTTSTTTITGTLGGIAGPEYPCGHEKKTSCSPKKPVNIRLLRLFVFCHEVNIRFRRRHERSTISCERQPEKRQEIA